MPYDNEKSLQISVLLWACACPHKASIVASFRNARTANGVVGVSAADFQGGAFRDQIAMHRAQLQPGGGENRAPGLSQRAATSQSFRLRTQHRRSALNCDVTIGSLPFTRRL